MCKMPLFFWAICLSFLMLSACGSSPSSSSSNTGTSSAEAIAAAQSALNRMDGGQTPVANPNTPAAQQGATVSTGSKPVWVDSVDSVYGGASYIAAIGYAADRAMAERNALASLVSRFGQSIRADQTIINTYNEAMRNGVTTGWTDNISMQNAISTSTSMDTLIGAEIREVWYDSRNTYYAVAVMEKARTAQVYGDMISANQSIINNLITMSQTEKNSLEGFSRYQFAAAVADINVSYGNVLQVIGAPLPAGLVRGDTYRLEAQNITRAIPVGIAIKNDKAGRIQSAFAKSLSDLGFRSGGNNSRYILNVNIVVSPVDFPGNENEFARMELSAHLTDTSSGAVLLPYNFNIREGALTLSEAEDRTYRTAERRINAEHSALLNNYLSQLLPQRR